MSEGQLRQRDWRVRVAGIEIEGLDIAFEIEKSLRPEPNKAQLTVFNLTRESRQRIEELNLYDPKKSKGTKAKKTSTTRKAGTPRAPKLGKIRVELEVGYLSTGRSLIFRGDLRRAVTKHDGPNICTEIEGEDGGRTYLASRITESFPAGTSKLTVVRALCDALGLGVGNLQDVAYLLSGTYPHGTVADGLASSELDGVLRGAGVQYSIQNGVLQFVVQGRGLERTAVLLNQDTGLVGSPEWDAAGVVNATSLMIPDAAPGTYVKLESRDFTGVYRAVACKYQGDTSGNEWYIHWELVPA